MSEIVVITGAARSIGLELALSLSADYGYDVFAGVRKETDFIEVTSQDRCGMTGIGSLTPLQMDVTKADELAAAAEMVSSRAGGRGVRGIINCPGLLYNAFVEFVDIEKWNEAYDVQLNGNIRMFQAFANLLRQNGDARFVMLSSPMAFMGLPTMGSNALNRGATEALANVMRLELIGQGIQIPVIWPLGVRGGQVKKSEPQLEAIETKLKENKAWAPYKDAYASFKAFMGSMTWQTDAVPPSVVVPAALAALRDQHPKLRYVVGKGPDGDFLPRPSKAFLKAYESNFWPK